jgi:hypothetical protein
MKAPNGWISHDLCIWNELDRRGFVSKGFVLEIPDLRHGSDRALDGFHESVRQFKPEETIHQNCWHQGVQAGRNFGFFADGYFHNLVILKRRPQRTRRGLFWALTSLPFLGYSITVNLYSLNVRREIDRTEKSLERVRGDYRAEGKHSLLTAREIKEQHIRQLAQGDVVPLLYDFVVHVWDSTEDALISKTRQIDLVAVVFRERSHEPVGHSSSATPNSSSSRA